MRTGEKEAAKKGECNQTETIGQKHPGGKEQRTGGETDKNKILTVGTQRLNCWGTMQRPFLNCRQRDYMIVGMGIISHWNKLLLQFKY